jgi:hypothetical protein
LSKFHKPSLQTCIGREFNLDFAATASAVLIQVHVSDKLFKRKISRSRAAVEDETQLRFQQFAKPLEEPFVRIYFTIIPLLYSKNKVYSVSYQNFIVLEPKVTGSRLKAMQNILGRFFCILIHAVF